MTRLCTGDDPSWGQRRDPSRGQRRGIADDPSRGQRRDSSRGQHHGTSTGELVEVTLRTTPDGPVPGQFQWRARSYVVLDVLSRWTESGSWWRGAAVTALMTGGAVRSQGVALETAPIPASPKWAQRAWGEPAPDVGASVGPAGIDDRAQQWWRVEAASGRASASSAGAGVYDLCFCESSGHWSLARILD